MMSRLLRFAHTALILSLVGCSSLAPFLATPTAVPVISATVTPQPPAVQTEVPVDGARILRVWLPPRFDPNANTASANLLKQRIYEFETQHPGLQIEIRVKAEEGDAGLLNSLSVTSMAAPSIMPDLIALTHSDMDTAVLKGLLHPMDGLTTLLQDPDWYAFARQMGRVQNTGFGLPFASDALVILYRPAVFEEPPSSWESIFASGNQMVYPPSDPQAFFSLALYLSETDQPSDGQGNLTIDEDALVHVLSFHKNAMDSNVVDPSRKEDRTEQQSLQIYYDGRAGAAIIWASRDLKVKSGRFAPLHGLNDSPYTLADGWVWALAGEDNENAALAVELASWLVESDFLSEWTHLSGYLPTRPQALAGWEEAELKQDVNDLLQFARPMPSEDVLSILGPILQGAVIRVFNGEQPEAVARSVIEGLK
jgi:multiple sugar transport system substrate-binding protein